MKTLRNHCPMESVGMAVVAAVAAVSLLSAVLLAFVDDGATPWFAVDTHQAALLVRCEAMPASTARHHCLREVAAASAQTMRDSTALARP